MGDKIVNQGLCSAWSDSKIEALTKASDDFTLFYLSACFKTRSSLRNRSLHSRSLFLLTFWFCCPVPEAVCIVFSVCICWYKSHPKLRNGFWFGCTVVERVFAICFYFFIFSVAQRPINVMLILSLLFFGQSAWSVTFYSISAKSASVWQ